MSEEVDALHYQLAKDTLKALIEVLELYVGNWSWVEGERTVEDCWKWEEEEIFNESRLYEALGKDDARTVLGVWRKFKKVCQLVRKYKNWQGGK